MGTDYPRLVKKWVYVSILLVMLVVLSRGIFTRTCPMKPELGFLAKTENKSSEQPADPNQLSEQKQEAAKEKGKRGPEHTHPAFSQRRHEREEMVAEQIQSRGVNSRDVLNAIETVPRHAFVRARDSSSAYDDRPLPIGLGQTISQPYIVGYMTEALKLRPDFRILEIGTGSGYQAAVCAEIAQEVYTIEIIKELAEPAEKRLKDLGYNNVSVKAGDGYFGWVEKGPFDAIIITAAAGLVPPPLVKQLKPDGRMILPLGSPFGAQTLVLITKDNKGSVQSKSLLPVQFVPMVGHITEVEQSSQK